jgi:hypothetical protein
MMLAPSAGRALVAGGLEDLADPQPYWLSGSAYELSAVALDNVPTWRLYSAEQSVAWGCRWRTYSLLVA